MTTTRRTCGRIPLLLLVDPATATANAAGAEAAPSANATAGGKSRGAAEKSRGREGQPIQIVEEDDGFNPAASRSSGLRVRGATHVDTGKAKSGCC